ncbi:MAG: cytochrome ubiquinol oxidase subunit [Solirubrobacterales bacterium]|jgi:cytochrome d ubiquinol oxidase subunit I|nr:cytochrome ubiquinol oxidase subunit [Solirubrobacterales bacterium]
MPDPGLLLADSSNLLAARNQMAFTLGFHIILACLGVAFPAIMLIAEYRGRRHGDPDALKLAERWSRAVAVLFAVGAVTGTVLSFEMGLLWPHFMERFGDAVGIGFAIEGLFFFTEAIFIAIYIYGWKRLPGWAHFWSGIPIFIAGLGGAASVVAVNSWMNQPAGFELDAQGNVTDVSPWEVLTNPASGYEIPHMILAAYMVAGFGVASVYAVGMLKGRRDRYHRVGFLIPFTVACIVTPIQIFVGDTAAREIADHQPAKFAAMECVYETGPDQTEWIGGICQDGEVKYGIGLPGVDSFLVGWSTDTVVTGLDQIADDEEPQALTLLHTSFDVMVGIGSALLALAAWFAFVWWRRRDLPQTVWFLRAAAVSGVASIIALEAGWIVTEVGRQPWIVQGHMKVEDAVTDAQGLWWVLGFTFLLYVALGVGAYLALRALSRRWREADPAEVTEPYSPRHEEATR